MMRTERQQGDDAPLSAERLRARAGTAREMLRRCEVCALRCGVDRTRGAACPCRLDDRTFSYKQYVSLNEEAELLPAYRVFFAGCNFRCSFCDEGPWCFAPHNGEPVDPAAMAAELGARVAGGIRTISLLGGEATLHPHTILEMAAAADAPLPLVVNSNMYMTPQVLDLLSGVVRLYLADFKFGNDECAKRIAHVPDYMATVCGNLLHAAKTTPLIIRHVLLPGHFDCCFVPVVDWLSAQMPGQRFELFTGYVPCWKAARDEQIGRLNTRDEAERAIAYAAASSLVLEAPLDACEGEGEAEHSGAADSRPSRGEVTITLGVDGRVYCHDLAPELAALAAALCAPDPNTIGARSARPRQGTQSVKRHSR